MIALKQRTPLVIALLLVTGAASGARRTFSEEAADPFDSQVDNLPDLEMAPESHAGEKQLAAFAKAFGEASMKDNGLDSGDQARQFAFNEVQSRVSQQLESWLSPWGNASVELKMDDRGHLTGSRGNWLVPLSDTDRLLTYTRAGLTQQDEGLVSNLGIGQRWIAGRWLLGYNTFYDAQLAENLQRGGFGAEAWGEYLRLSANYYQPFNAWQDDGSARLSRMARGYDLTARARLPFYQHINTSVSFEQYFGDSVDLFHSGTGYHNPLAVAVGFNYTPVPLVTVSAQHKQGESGVSQNNLGLKLNYRFGVPLKKQLQASEVAAVSSLRGSRYDSPERNDLPVVEYRQRKTLSVFLATPPWDLQPGETVQLKLQIQHSHAIRSLRWQGDTQALSLTPPVNANSADGWTIIMPQWDYREGASNRWTLSLVAEDDQGQRVSSNEIALTMVEPVVTFPQTEPGWMMP